MPHWTLIVGIAGFAVMGLLAWCVCATAGQADDDMERMMAERAARAIPARSGCVGNEDARSHSRRGRGRVMAEMHVPYSDLQRALEQLAEAERQRDDLLAAGQVLCEAIRNETISRILADWNISSERAEREWHFYVPSQQTVAMRKIETIQAIIAGVKGDGWVY